jgi:hypothetical protein
VRLRLEATPPEGVSGKQLSRLTQTTRRSVKRSLKQFASLVRNEQAQEGVGTLPAGLQPMATALAIPLGAGVAGGIASAALLERRSAQVTRITRRKQAMERMERRGAVAGWLMTLAGAADLLAAVNFRRRGDQTKALTTSQHAPTLLGAGILARLLLQRPLSPTRPGAIASWAFTSAALGALASSTLAHLRGRRGEGVFLGQWTPLFLTAAIVSRLFSHK